MGTANFHSSQASRIFAVTGSYEDEDGEMREDEFIWEDTRSNVMYELLAIDKDKEVDWEFVAGDDYKIYDELRSFPSTSIGQFYTGVHYAGTDFTITIVPKTVSAYYDGFCLDFDICLSNDNGIDELINDGLECGVGDDDMEYMFEEYEYQNPYMKGVLVMHGDRLIAKINAVIEDGIERIEKVFSDFSDPLMLICQASNGEAFYERASI